MKTEEIKKAIENHKCPGSYFCTVATTGYEPNKRKKICLSCWLEHCRENKIEVEE